MAMILIVGNTKSKLWYRFLGAPSTQKLVKQMKANGEKMTYLLIMEKNIWRLTLHFEYMVAAIEESKDLSGMSNGELQGLLAAYKHRSNSKNFTVAIEEEFQY